MGMLLVEPDLADHRSIRLKDDLEKTWREVKRLPLGERERWLNLQEAVVGLSASRRADILRAIADRRGQLERVVPSEPWFRSTFHEGLQFPPGGDDTGMVVSEQKTRWGDGRPSYRYLPAIASNLEDMIDGMNRHKAGDDGARWWPESPSAKVIQQIESRRGGPATARELRRLARTQKARSKPAQAGPVEVDFE